MTDYASLTTRIRQLVSEAYWLAADHQFIPAAEAAEEMAEKAQQLVAELKARACPPPSER